MGILLFSRLIITAAAMIILIRIAVEDIRTMMISDIHSIMLLMIAAAAAAADIAAGQAVRDVITDRIAGTFSVSGLMLIMDLIGTAAGRAAGVIVSGSDVRTVRKTAGKAVVKTAGKAVVKTAGKAVVETAGKAVVENAGETAGKVSSKASDIGNKDPDKTVTGYEKVIIFGGGDILLCFSSGALLGVSGMLTAAAIAAVSSGVFAAAALVTGKLERDSAFSFGPFLAFGIAVMLAADLIR